MVSAAIKALHQCHPGMFRTQFIGHYGSGSDTPPGNNLFAGNPHDSRIDLARAQHITIDYGPAIQQCGRPYHFLEGPKEDMERKLGVKIDIKEFRGDIYLSDEEMKPWPGLAERYALINAGYKNDFTAKMWSHYRYQEVVNATKDEIQWVQVGSANDNHRPLENVINLVGQTNIRQMCQVMYRAAFVVCPVTFHMHLAAAVPTPEDGPREMPLTIGQLHERYWHERQAQLSKGPGPQPLPGGQRKVRPCIVLAGQREPVHYDAGYPGNIVLGATGKLKCGVGVGQSCWRNKTVPVDSDMNLCMKPLPDEEGFAVPECLHRVNSSDVIAAVRTLL